MNLLESLQKRTPVKEVEIIDWDGVEFGVSVRYADNTTTAYHVGDMVAARKEAAVLRRQKG
jgi:hypothetical protein